MMKLGLTRGTVALVAHQALWKKSFEKERVCLKEALGEAAIDIQHVGSTSIPGIPAKPIIDISVGVRKFREARRLVRAFEALGYEWRKDAGGPYMLLFVKGPEVKRTHYIHIMRYGGAQWRSTLLFRDYLTRDPKRAAMYAALKKTLAARYPDDRASYTAGKAGFILKTLRIARK